MGVRPGCVVQMGGGLQVVVPAFEVAQGYRAVTKAELMAEVGRGHAKPILEEGTLAYTGAGGAVGGGGYAGVHRRWRGGWGRRVRWRTRALVGQLGEEGMLAYTGTVGAAGGGSLGEWGE